MATKGGRDTLECLQGVWCVNTTSNNNHKLTWVENEEEVNWSEIAKRLNGRNNKDCRKRWVYTLCPSINKGSWAEEEDALLTRGIEIHGLE